MTDPILISLADMSRIFEVAYRTPFSWWKRAKSGEADFPMPNPVARVVDGKTVPTDGLTGGLSNFGLRWDRAEVVAWYTDYQAARR